MKITLPTMEIGKMIFLSRVEKGLTQEQLSDGICSIPYLSKLENSKIEPSHDILNPLLTRLHIQLDLIRNEYQELVQLLEQWYDSIVNRDQDVAKLFKQKMQDTHFNVLPPDLTHFIQLLNFRYALYEKDLATASDIIASLEKIKKNMSSQALHYFTYFKGIFFCIEADYFKGKECFLKAEQGFLTNQNTSLPELQFHLAFAFSKLHDISMAIYYADNAKQLFTQQLKYTKIIECDLIIGINLTRQERYQEAREKFRTIISMCKLNQFQELCAKGLHNLAFLESKSRNHHSAIKLYEEALTLKVERDNSHLNTLLHLADEHRNLHNIEKVNNIYDEIITLCDKYNLSKEFYYKAIIGKLKVSDAGEALITLLEEEVIPYFEYKNDKTSLSNLFFSAAETFEKERKYKKSSEYYKKAYRLLSTKREELE
ncbi:helix-turn-helix domain-containing protein [Rossellomorea sp. H39__3]